jgi:uncharacterized membrane protein
LLATQSLSRFSSYHNRTFDLALYARQAWGLAHGDYWDPIIHVHFLGTHLAVILWPLGWLGRVFGEVPVLLVAQALAVGFASLPLANIGARRFGDIGALCAAAAWLAYPNISHVASYEFHPGTLAVLPLALALDALDAQRGWRFVLSCLGILACRADLAFLTALVALMPLLKTGTTPGLVRAARVVLLLSGAYLVVQYAVLRPSYWAVRTSLDLHFARWGGTPVGILRALFDSPWLVIEHLSAPKRLMYLPLILWPLGFLPLFAPRYWLPLLPFIAINLISTFPTTVELYSHYLTLAVPTLVVAALEALKKLTERAQSRRAAVVGLVGMLAIGFAADIKAGGYPWSVSFERAAFVPDEQSAQAERIVAAIRADASVQAPDALLPHLIARSRVHRMPPPDREADSVVLDVSHRVRYGGREDLLRTLEEPMVRYWLARRDYGLVSAEGDYLLFERGREPRDGPAARYLSGLPAGDYGVALTRCLSVLSAWLDPQGLELELAAHAPCPADLALRIGMANGRERVDLLFDGLLSPAQLHEERVFSWHALSPEERSAIVKYGLSLGALRASGAPPEYGDPFNQPIAVIH